MIKNLIVSAKINILIGTYLEGLQRMTIRTISSLDLRELSEKDQEESLVIITGQELLTFTATANNLKQVFMDTGIRVLVLATNPKRTNLPSTVEIVKVAKSNTSMIDETKRFLAKLKNEEEKKKAEVKLTQTINSELREWEDIEVDNNDNNLLQSTSELNETADVYNLENIEEIGEPDELDELDEYDDLEIQEIPEILENKIKEKKGEEAEEEGEEAEEEEELIPMPVQDVDNELKEEISQLIEKINESDTMIAVLRDELRQKEEYIKEIKECLQISQQEESLGVNEIEEQINEIQISFYPFRKKLYSIESNPHRVIERLRRGKTYNEI